MNKLFNFLSAAFVCLLVVSCSKNNETDLSGNNNGNPSGGGTNTCDTANMQYSINIAPIIQANCFACHSNTSTATSGAPFSLEGYSNLKARVDDGRLMGSITHAAGFKPMPQGGPKLSDCNINKIRAWINRGAQNN